VRYPLKLPDLPEPVQYGTAVTNGTYPLVHEVAKYAKAPTPFMVFDLKNNNFLERLPDFSSAPLAALYQ